MSSIFCPFLFVSQLRKSGQLGAGLGTQAALGQGGELADRVDLVAEELEAIRSLGIGGEDVQDTAAATEFAGNLHGVAAAKAVGQQPGTQSFEIDDAAGRQGSAVLDELVAVGNRLDQGLDGGQQTAGRRLAFQGLQDAQTLPGYLVDERGIIG